MFDLEESIADWRKQMLAAGIKSPVPPEELEIHLREEIERQMQPGGKGSIRSGNCDTANWGSRKSHLGVQQSCGVQSGSFLEII